MRRTVPEPQLDAFSPARVGRLLALCIVALVAAHIATSWIKQQGGVPGDPAQLFNLDQEANIPTWFSSALLLAAAFISYVIARQERALRPREARYWSGLVLMLLLMSIDETASIHETFGPYVAQALGIAARGVLHYAWVVPGLAAVALVGACYLRFVLRLPSQVRTLTFLAAAFYVVGAIGCEMIGSALIEAGVSHAAWPMRLEVIAEETLEMSGAALWIYAQLVYLEGLRRARQVPRAPNGLTDRVKLRSCERPEARGGRILDVFDRRATKGRDANARFHDGRQTVRRSSAG